jgi:putative transposase
MEQEIRKKAIVRYLNGESAKDIYTELKRSERWFFKWLKRFKTGDLHWYKDRSRAPLTRPSKISEKKRQLIISIRKRLESDPFAQVGVSAIKWELSKLGIDFPSDSMINRVLKKEGLVKKNCLCSQRSRVSLFH